MDVVRASTFVSEILGDLSLAPSVTVPVVVVAEAACSLGKAPGSSMPGVETAEYAFGVGIESVFSVVVAEAVGAEVGDLDVSALWVLAAHSSAGVVTEGWSITAAIFVSMR